MTTNDEERREEEEEEEGGKKLKGSNSPEQTNGESTLKSRSQEGGAVEEDGLHRGERERGMMWMGRGRGRGRNQEECRV
jgi:hypothetical protein